MSKATVTLAVEPRENLIERVREAFLHRGWEVEARGSELVAREDATRLCCVETPAIVSLQFHEDQGATGVNLEARVPGYGPVANRNVRSRLAFAARTVLRVASPAGPSL